MTLEDSPQLLVQAVRPVHKNNLSPTTPAAVSHVVVHVDPSCNKNIILWDDVLQAFRDGLYIKHGTVILPFLKDSHFTNLVPLRYAAISGATLDVVVDGQVTSTDPPLVQSTFDEIANQAARYPPYDPLESIRPPTIPRATRPVISNHANNLHNNRTMPTSAFWNQERAPIQHTRVLSQQSQVPPNPNSSRPPTSRPHSSRPVSAPKPRSRMDVKEAFRRIIVHIDLAALEEKGEGTPQEFTKALECYLKAIRQGHAHAHLSVGELFAQGEDVVQDDSRAFEWYLKAAYQGNAIAQRKISRLVFNQPNRLAAAPEAVLDNKVLESPPTPVVVTSAHAHTEPTETRTETLLKLPETPAEEVLEETVKVSEYNARQVAVASSVDVSSSSDSREWLETPSCTPNARSPQLDTNNSDLTLLNAGYGDPEAQVRLGNMYLENANRRHDEAAFQWFLKAARQGDKHGQNRVGFMFTTGRGVSKDYSGALIWFLKAAEQGLPDAQFNLGLLYHRGVDVTRQHSWKNGWHVVTSKQEQLPIQTDLGIHSEKCNRYLPDYGQAMEWHLKAAKQGHAPAQRSVGYLFDHGLGVTQDYTKAMEWYMKAGKQDDVIAQANIGRLHELGLGVPQNCTEAAKWYECAARQQNVGAQVRLGVLYRTGRGVRPSFSDATEWLLKAAGQGSTEALKILNGMYERP